MRNGRYGRRIGARPVSELATLRVHAINRSAEAAGSHAIYVSKPEAVAALIAKAAKSLGSETAA